MADKKKPKSGQELSNQVQLAIVQSLDKIAAQKGRSELMLLNVINNEMNNVGAKLQEFAENNHRLQTENTALRQENAMLKDALVKVGEQQTKSPPVAGEPDNVTS